MCRQVVHVQTSGKANADKGRKCGEILLVQTNVAYADKCCKFGKMWQITWKVKRQ